jgi:hypothetical protein
MATSSKRIRLAVHADVAAYLSNDSNCPASNSGHDTTCRKRKNDDMTRLSLLPHQANADINSIIEMLGSIDLSRDMAWAATPRPSAVNIPPAEVPS